MVGQPINVLGQPVGIELLDHLNDPAIEGPPAVLEEASERHVMREGVSERVFEVGVEPRFVKELGGLKLRQTLAQAILTLIRNRLQKRERHVLADNRSRLEQPLVLGSEPVDADGQDRLRRSGDLQTLPGLLEPIRPALAREDLRLDQRPDALFEEERVSFRSLDKELLYGRQTGIGSEERLE